MEAPFAENLVYSSHNYTRPSYEHRQCPITEEMRKQNVQHQRELFLAHEGTRYMQRYSVPLWVGEFGGNSDCGLEDQLVVLEEYGVHWTIWTYKDIGVMGLLNVDPASKYMQALAPVLQAKRDLALEAWFMQGVTGTRVGGPIGELAGLIEEAIGDGQFDSEANRSFLAQAALDGYAASMMQPAYARQLEGLSEAELDLLLQSFAFENCHPRQAILAVLKRHWS